MLSDAFSSTVTPRLFHPGGTILPSRNVIAAESNTLLIWNDQKKKFFGTNSNDAKVGDCVPVTGYLKEPPIVTKFVDMEPYFPKNKYVWGTEFNKAWKMMN